VALGQKRSTSKSLDFSISAALPAPLAPAELDVTRIPGDAPNPLIEYRSSITRHELIVTNDKQRAVIAPKLRPLICREQYESEYEIQTIPGVLPAVAGRPITCQISGLKDPHTNSWTPLVEVLRRAVPEGGAWVVLDFKDSDDNEFSRQFTLHRNTDDSVTWIPGPISARGACKISSIETGDLAKLRARLVLADGYHDTKAAADQWLAEALRLKDTVTQQEHRLNDWPRAANAIALAGEANRLRQELNALNGDWSAKGDPNAFANPLNRAWVSDIAEHQLSADRWRFHMELRQLRMKLPEALANDVPTPDIPSDLSRDAVLSLLSRIVGDLESYAANLLRS
jgi:hypothetical protein